MGRGGNLAETETGFLGEPVLLAGVAGTAGRDDVLPAMGAAPRSRHDVVEVLGSPPAVLAPVAVPSEDAPARQRNTRAKRHTHEVHEPDHRRHRDGCAFGAEFSAVSLDDLGLLLEHEHDRSAG
jgi:hypothetical protein